MDPTPLMPKPQMLGGDDEASIDDKGRLLLSARQRKMLGNDFVIGESEYGCLQLHPAWSWARIDAEFDSVDWSNPFRIDYYEEIYGRAEFGVEYDGQGRMMVPRRWRESMGIVNKAAVVRVVGVGDRLLIWQPADLAQYRKDKSAYKKENRERVQRLRESMLGYGRAARMVDGLA